MNSMNNAAPTPEQNPNNVVGAALARWTAGFASVAFLGLMLWSAPQLLLLFIDNLPSLPRIDLAGLLTPLVTNEATLDELMRYSAAGAFSVSPVSIAIGALVGLLLTPFFNACCALLALNGFYGRNADTRELLAEAGRHYFRFIGTHICATLVSAAIYLVSAAIVFVSFLTMFSATAGMIGVFAFTLSAALMMAAAFAASSLQSMSIAVAVGEQRGGFRAVMRAWRLLRVRFIRNVFTIVLAGIAANYLLSVVQNIVTLATNSYFAGSVIGALAGGIFTAFAVMCAARCYIASRSRAGEFGMPGGIPGIFAAVPMNLGGFNDAYDPDVAENPWDGGSPQSADDPQNPQGTDNPENPQDTQDADGSPDGQE